MKRKILWLSFFAALSAFAFVAFAQENKLQQFQTKQQEVQAQIKQARDKFKQQVEAQRTEVKTKIEAARQELKVRLQKIKDESKKAVVEKIDQQINELNNRMLNHFSNVLNQIEDVLTRVISRTDKAEANGRDVSAVRTAIVAAKNAIAAGRSAIEAQTGKTYTIAINTDETLRQDVGKARQAFHSDLVKVREMVFAARDAVRKVVVLLAQIPGVDGLKLPSNKTATSTSQ